MTRGQLARQADVNFETIRYYEKMKLMPEPERTESGYRIYTQEAVTLIQFIKRAQELGFSLKEISELLSLRVDSDTTCADVKERTEDKIKDIEDKMQDLQMMKEALSKLATTCSGEGPTSECPILDAMGAPLKLENYSQL